ncbi:hypothetical protein [Mesorhizobium sp. KR2-14]|uniref:hypothetical protein n=1 Tax=Mesorhizobium sp. KR2-14 TaxID=3156610 RepID=UPI0032B3C4A8
MGAFIGILGGLQIVVGVLLYLVAKSAMHEILAATTFGMGVLAIGLGVLIENTNNLLSKMDRPKT